MGLDVVVGGVECLPDAVEIGNAVGRPRRRIGLLLGRYRQMRPECGASHRGSNDDGDPKYSAHRLTRDSLSTPNSQQLTPLQLPKCDDRMAFGDWELVERKTLGVVRVFHQLLVRLAD